MDKLATAYVQVIPSAQGMQGNLASIFGKEMPTGGKSAGSLFSSGMLSTIKRAVATAGIGKVLSSAIMEGSELQQLRGGVEKIFNDMDTSAIFADAANAYKDLGMSANQYMATINDVGAAFASTMGDAKGYDVARTGLQAISDYASGTGKSVDLLSQKFAMITRSTSSYQSIADQFSGILPATSADFLKQAQAAGLLEGKYKKLTEVPVAEYQAAVSSMLEKGTADLGLAGNTAAEAATTISGSFAAMKASFSNVLGSLTLGQDIGPSLNALAQTTVTFLKGNLAPAVINIVKALPGAACTFIKAMLPGDIGGVVTSGLNSLTQFITAGLPSIMEQGTSMVTQFISGFTMGLPGFVTAAGDLLGSLSVAVIQAVPLLVESGISIVSSLGEGLLTAAPSMLQNGMELIVNLASGLVASLPKVTKSINTIVSNLLSTLAANLPNLLQSGADLILNLARGLIASLPQVISSAVSIISNLLSTFASHLPDLLAQGISMISQLVSGLISMIPDVISAGKDIVTDLWNTIKETDWITLGSNVISAVVSGLISMIGDVVSAGADIASDLWNSFTDIDWLELGVNIIEGIAAGIWDAATSIFDAMKSIASDALQAAKDALSIKSPSRRARKEVGYQIPAGEALGILDGIPLVEKANRRLIDASMPRFVNNLRMNQNNRPAPSGEQPQGRVIHFVQNIYSEAKTAADLMREARYQAETAVLLGV